MTGRGRPRDVAGLSDTGRVREHNEDTLLLEPPLFAVADGLGGHQAGEVASRIAVDTLREHAPRRADAKALGRAVRQANRAVMEAADAGRGRAGMGTTLTVVMREGLKLAVAHVGDSRAYLLHARGLERLTEDHSLVADMVRQGTLTEEEARNHPNRSVITRALGSDPTLTVDTFEARAEPGDRLLLCTDGLSGMLEDAEIERILAAAPTPEEAVRRLVDAANAAGGYDNVTAVVADLEEAVAAEPGRGGWASRALWVLTAIALLVAAAYGAWAYARSRAYLVDEGGNVVLYRGVQGEFAGVSLNWREQETTIPVAALGPVTAMRLREGVPVDGVGEGRTLLDGYRARVSGTPGPSGTP